MSTPWLGDACSLVDAFRAGELTPAEAVETVIASAESDPYNAICHIDADGAREAAASADVSKPFGGVPVAVKELEMVEGWPYAYGTKLLEGMTGSHTMVHVERIRDIGGAIPFVQTTSSEMGLVGYTSTIVHGTTTNPWDTDSHSRRLLGWNRGCRLRRHSCRSAPAPTAVGRSAVPRATPGWSDSRPRSAESRSPPWHRWSR